MKPAVFELVRATSVAEAVSCLATSDGMARVMAGGQSLVPMLNLRLAGASQVIDLSQITELKSAAIQDNVAIYGAGITHAQIEDGVVPDAARGLMRKAAAGIAYRAIRNRGTMAGSLALSDPSADWVAVMVALDADVELIGPDGGRMVPVRSFVLGAYTTVLEDDELIRTVRVSVLPEDARWGFVKICRKLGEFAQSLAVVVAVPSLSYWRVVVGATDGAPIVLENVAHGLQKMLQTGWQDISAQLVYKQAQAGLREAGLEDDFLVDLQAASVVAAVKEAVSNERNNDTDA